MAQSSNMDAWKQKVLALKKERTRTGPPSVWGPSASIKFIEHYTGLKCMFSDETGMKEFIDANWDTASASAKEYRKKVAKKILGIDASSKKMQERSNKWNDIINNFNK